LDQLTVLGLNNFWRFISVVVPWLIAVPFYSGAGLINVINWASLFLQSTVNFIFR